MVYRLARILTCLLLLEAVIALAWGIGFLLSGAVHV